MTRIIRATGVRKSSPEAVGGDFDEAVCSEWNFGLKSANLVRFVRSFSAFTTNQVAI